MPVESACWGPALTLVLTISILLGGCLGVLQGATDSGSTLLKLVSSASGAAAILATLLCHVVSPGNPDHDPDDVVLSTEEGFDEAKRTRLQKLPDGIEWEQKWCRICQLWRPHRCGHCRMCGRCILRLDHHCYWMGTCIGERNMRFFMVFLFCTAVSMIGLVILGIRHIVWLVPREGFFTMEVLMVVVFISACPPCVPLVFGSIGLVIASAWYAFVMLVDADPHDLNRQHFRCGVQLFCCSPLHRRQPPLRFPEIRPVRPRTKSELEVLHKPSPKSIGASTTAELQTGL